MVIGDPVRPVCRHHGSGNRPGKRAQKVHQAGRRIHFVLLDAGQGQPHRRNEEEGNRQTERHQGRGNVPEAHVGGGDRTPQRHPAHPQHAEKHQPTRIGTAHELRGDGRGKQRETARPGCRLSGNRRRIAHEALQP